MSNLQIGDVAFQSRLILGSGKFQNHTLFEQSILNAQCECVTLALKRIDFERADFDDILSPLQKHNIRLLPNTSGARNAEEAIFAAQLARECLDTAWIKLEIHPNTLHLMPDPIETLKAAEKLVSLGFTVLPYVHADPILCKRLEEIGCAAVMPLGSMIGSYMGLKTLEFLEVIVDQSEVPVIIDAGIGKPSDATQAMEIGADAVIINTAIATAENPPLVASAFELAVKAGRLAYEAGAFSGEPNFAHATSPLNNFLD